MDTQTADLLNAEQIQTIADTVAEFGFFGTSGDMEYADHERAAFVRFLNNPEQYFGGSFEYCNRFDGIRLHVSLNPSRTSVRYANLSLDGAWAPYTEEEVQAANERMAAVL